MDGGSPHLSQPLYFFVPGLDTPDLRVDGRMISAVRWPEASLMSVPNLAVESAAVRRSTPIDGPLSSTGGPILDLRLHAAPADRAVSAVRLTRGSYSTFTEEIVFRRPLGKRLLFAGFYGDAKTAGRDLWRRQFSETIGLRASHPFRGGALEWSYDAARYRNDLLASKRQLWDRRAAGMRWQRGWGAGRTLEGDLSWSHLRGGWWSARGLTERISDGVRGRFMARIDSASVPLSVAVELDGTRTRFKRYDGERRLLEDFSYGGAVGWERSRGGADLRVSGGVVRIAPLAPAPIVHGEASGEIGPRTRWLLHAGRAVRNRTIPRLPADGEAWVRQGIGLADEDSGEAGESLYRAGGGLRFSLGAQEIGLGAEGCVRARGLALDASDLEWLGTDGQDAIPESAMRRTRSFASPVLDLDLSLPWSFRLRGSTWANIAEGGWRSHLAFPAFEGTGEAGWRGKIFRGDLDLDLSLRWRGRDRVATPYGTLAPAGSADGRVSGRIGSAEIYFVLANITDAVSTSLSHDGRFMFMPRRHYRAGLAWQFVD